MCALGWFAFEKHAGLASCLLSLGMITLVVVVVGKWG